MNTPKFDDIPIPPLPTPKHDVRLEDAPTGKLVVYTEQQKASIERRRQVAIRRQARAAVPKRYRAAWVDFESTVGDRAVLLERLEHLPNDPRAIKLAEAIRDPANFRKSLIVVAHGLCKLTLGDVRQMNVKGYREMQLLEAEEKRSKALPNFMDEVVKDSLPEYKTCEQCLGEGKITIQGGKVTRPCFTCEGTGKLRIKADPKLVELMMKSSGLLPKDGGSQQNVQVNVNNPVKSVEDVLGDSDTIEAEVIEDAAEKP